MEKQYDVVVIGTGSAAAVVGVYTEYM